MVHYLYIKSVLKKESIGFYFFRDFKKNFNGDLDNTIGNYSGGNICKTLKLVVGRHIADKKALCHVKFPCALFLQPHIFLRWGRRGLTLGVTPIGHEKLKEEWSEHESL